MHTISVEASCPDDLGLHLDAVAMLDQADRLITPIEQSLEQAAREALGGAWMDSWQQGLPHWRTPGELNLPLLLWLHNLLEAGISRVCQSPIWSARAWWPLVSWLQCGPLDLTVTETDLLAVLKASSGEIKFLNLDVQRSCGRRASGAPFVGLTSQGEASSALRSRGDRSGCCAIC